MASQHTAGLVRWANITVPTIRGPIVVAATPTTLMVEVPCNTFATLCVQHLYGGDAGAVGAGSGDVSGVASGVVGGGGLTMPPLVLVMDGEKVPAAAATAHHLCTAQPVGCGVHGAARTLTAVRTALDDSGSTASGVPGIAL